jgi:hypothetical protein
VLFEGQIDTAPLPQPESVTPLAQGLESHLRRSGKKIDVA